MRSERKSPRKPGPGAVIVGSLALFAVLFALIAFQVGAGGGEQTQTTAEVTTTARESSLAAAGTEADEYEEYGDDDDEYYAEGSYEAEPSYEEAETETFVEEAPATRSGGS